MILIGGDLACPYCGTTFDPRAATEKPAEAPGEVLVQCPICEKWAWDAGFMLVALANPEGDT